MMKDRLVFISEQGNQETGEENLLVICKFGNGKLEVQHEIKGEFEVMCPYLNQQGELMVHALRRERNGNEVGYTGNCYNLETAK